MKPEIEKGVHEVLVEAMGRGVFGLTPWDPWGCISVIERAGHHDLSERLRALSDMHFGRPANNSMREKREETAMHNGGDKIQKLNSEATAAAWRAAAMQVAKRARTQLIRAARANGHQPLASFLRSDAGLAAVGMVLGLIQMHVPQLNGAKAAKLGEQLRVYAMQLLLDGVAEKYLAPIVDLFEFGAASLPRGDGDDS